MKARVACQRHGRRYIIAGRAAAVESPFRKNPDAGDRNQYSYEQEPEPSAHREHLPRQIGAAAFHLPRSGRHAHRSNESVAATGNGLDKPGIIGGVAQNLPELPDATVYGIVEIDVRILGPKALANFLSRDDFAGMLQQNQKGLEGLVLELQLYAVLSQLSRMRV